MNVDVGTVPRLSFSIGLRGLAAHLVFDGGGAFERDVQWLLAVVDRDRWIIFLAFLSSIGVCPARVVWIRAPEIDRLEVDDGVELLAGAKRRCRAWRVVWNELACFEWLSANDDSAFARSKLDDQFQLLPRRHLFLGFVLRGDLAHVLCEDGALACQWVLALCQFLGALSGALFRGCELALVLRVDIDAEVDD